MLIEAWADLVCPWCYIGKQHLDKALTTYQAHQGRYETEVTWRAYRLVPGMRGGSGTTLPEFMAQRSGLPAEAVAERLAMVTGVAADAGLDLRLDKALPVDTFDAHRVASLAAVEGQRGAVTERLMRAYATEGRDLSDHDTLCELAAECGLDAGAVRAVLASGDFTDQVGADEHRSRETGISGVPFLLVENRFAAGGAQDPEAIHALLDRAAAA
ncbi:DsbA family oxidoreductase [Streptomyces luteolus]|uniref:DsbA family oxidoreductase n=1 Tax=Streptomyces luteolus TaxID=3043615 RepID=A0ABT6T4W0_9ACTN|nr:DsbA family oxidoreductase [Streptomyces sp. B-S-A12]MDI3422094.1 DsbA family oxidoreductase [Streptomyces sp. B-S-A12]